MQTAPGGSPRQDFYLGRRAVEGIVAASLKPLDLFEPATECVPRGVPSLGAYEEARPEDPASSAALVRHQGLEPRTQ